MAKGDLLICRFYERFTKSIYPALLFVQSFCIGEVAANALDADLSEAIVRKLAQNAHKYPADKYRGRF